MSVSWLDEIRWTEDGLVPVIAQQADTGKVLMFAWMNRESLGFNSLRRLCGLLVQIARKIMAQR